MPELRPAVERETRARLDVAAADAFLTRLDQLSFDILEPLGQVYGAVTDPSKLATELVLDALNAAAQRPAPLRLLDRRREIDPAWFQRSRMIGYVCYADRFAGSLPGVREHLDYLAELGVTYLHLMPLLRPREGENDGGYAVADYAATDPRLGTMADLQALADDLHGRGMALCVDLVVNHTAAEHEWARRALAGEPGYREMYLIYPDRTEPDRYERTLPEVFPDTAPGSFTEVSGLGWVWTTFHDYQWDLNYANPAVFRAMLGTMLALANRGIDVLRVDAAPFLWKRMGTDCQNQPEAHALLQAFRALTRLAAPGLVLKAEAIVGPELLVAVPRRSRPVPARSATWPTTTSSWSCSGPPWPPGMCGWPRPRCPAAGQRPCRPRGLPTCAATTTSAGPCPTRTPPPPGSSGFEHRRFLSEFFAGRFPGSFARGAAVPGQRGDRGRPRSPAWPRRCAASRPRWTAGDQAELTPAIRRLESMYAVVFSFGGIPLIYMGDELALRNDTGWAGDPAHEHDNRWMHRPLMDWDAAARRHDPGSLEGRVFAAIRGLAAPGARCWRCARAARTELLPTENRSVLAYRRVHPRSAPFLALTNFSDVPQSVDAGIIARAGLFQPRTRALQHRPAEHRLRPHRPAAVGLRLAHRRLKHGMCLARLRACHLPIAPRECPDLARRLSANSQVFGVSSRPERSVTVKRDQPPGPRE